MSNVNHPNHYNKFGRKECIVEMEELFGFRFVIDFCIGNCYKYLYRAGDKENNSAEQDKSKAKWYYDYANNLVTTHNLNKWYVKEFEYIENLLNQN